MSWHVVEGPGDGQSSWQLGQLEYLCRLLFPSLQCCLPSASLLPPCCLPAASLLPPCCLPSASLVPPCCLPSASLLPPCCLPSASLVPPFCLPSSPLLPPCCLPAAPQDFADDAVQRDMRYSAAEAAAGLVRPRRSWRSRHLLGWEEM